MKKDYSYLIFYRLIVCTLLLGLPLQGCSSFSNSPISRIEGSPDIIQGSNEYLDVKELVEQKLTAEGWELVNFYEGGGELKVIEHDESFREGHDLVVCEAKDIDLRQASRLNLEEQNRPIHIPGARNGQTDYVIVSKVDLLREIWEEEMENGQTWYKKGKVVYDDKNYNQAKICFEKAAAQGNSNGYLWLGNLYSSGCGVTRNYSMANRFYEQAAALGNLSGYGNLAFSYEEGLGVQQNFSKARELYEKAASGEDANMQTSLGTFYFRRLQDYNKAEEWWLKAAIQGDANAEINLGNLYYSGLGVPQDYFTAQIWYEMAAAQGNIQGQRKLANTILKLRSLEAKM